MITAKEARRNVQEYKEELLKVDKLELESILNNIEKESKKAKMKLEIDNTISDFSKLQLELLGYEVFIINQPNPTDGWPEKHTTITW